MSESTIDRLDIKIESESSGANKELDKLINGLSTLSSMMKGVNFNGMKGVSSNVKKASSSMKTLGKNTNDIKKADALVRILSNRFKDLGKSSDISKYGSAKGLETLKSKLSQAKDKVEQLKASGNTKGATFENAVASAVKYEHELDRVIAKEKGRKGATYRRVGAAIDKNKDAAQNDVYVQPVKKSVPKVSTPINTNPIKTDTNVGKENEVSTSSTDNLKKSLSVVSGLMSGLKQKAGEFGTKLNTSVGKKINTEQYTSLKKEVDKATQSLEKLEAKERKMESLGTAGDKSSTWKSLQYDIQATEDKISSLQSKMNGLKATNSSAGSIFKTIGSSGVSAFTNIKNAIGSAGSGLSKGFSGISKVGSVIKNVGSGIGGVVGKFNIFKSASGGVIGAAKNIAGSFLKVGKMAKLMILRMAIRGAINGMKEGFSNLAQYSGSVNAQISNLMSSLNYLKNSLAAAFAPILSVVVPILSTMINYLVSAINAIGMFIAAITGKSSYTKAVKQQSNYAGSLADTGSAASDAADSVKELKKTVLGFDELNQMDSQDNSSGGSGGGGGAGGGGIGAGDMFDTVGIDSGIADFAKKLKDMFKAGDYEGIGKLLGEKINEQVQKIYDFINWDNLGGKITKACDGICRTFNSLVYNIDWNLIGRTIGAGVNTIINTLDLLFTGIDWIGLGNAFGDGINGIFQEIDWTKLGKTIGDGFMVLPRILIGAIQKIDWPLVGKSFADCLNGLTKSIDLGELANGLCDLVNGAAEGLITFVKEYDWSALGKNISTGINNLFQNTDWGQLAKSISDFAKGILETLKTALKNLDWGAVGKGIVDFIVHIDWLGLAADLLECGYYLITGLIQGIVDTIAETDWGAIWNSIVESVKDFFGIHSPSTVFEEFGGYMIEGLYNGLVNTIGTVLDWFGDLPGLIKEKLGDAKTWLTEKGSGAVEGLKNGWESVKESKLGQTLSKVGGYAKDKIGNIKDAVKEKGQNIADGLRNGYDAVKDGKLFNTIGKIKGSIKDKIGDVSSQVNGKGQDIVNGLSSGFSGKINTFYTAVSGIAGKVRSSLSGLGGIASSAMQSFRNAFSSIHIPMPHFSFSTKSYKIGTFAFSIPSVSCKWYKNGGPIDGELWGMNESGNPEMVGKVGNGGKTAVANNQMITDAIRDAVVQGMVQVMSTNQGNNENVTLEFTFQADSETMYKMVKKGEQKANRRYSVTALA